jgi:tetratricopeptide (TPR) repeat protein
MRFFRTFAAIAIALAAFIILAWCGLNLFAWGRITGAPTTREFEAIARGGQPLAQAISDYRSDHGVLPDSPRDLVPAYLAKWPKEWTFYQGDLDHLSGLPHTHIVCSFDETTNRWMFVGEYAQGRTINVPGPSIKKSSVSADNVFANRLALFEKRITSKPREWYAYRDKIAFTALSGSNVLAITECVRASNAFTNWWMPQMALAELLTNDVQAEENFKTWVQEHPTFINYWYLSRFYREKDNYEAAFAALEQATGSSFTSYSDEIEDLKLQLRQVASGKTPKLPANDDIDDASWSSDAFALDAVRFCCQQRKYALALKIIQHCKIKDSPYNVCTELGLGQFDVAIADAHKLAQSNAQSDWIQQLPHFLEVASAHSTNFCFVDSDESSSDWTLFTMPGEVTAPNAADTLDVIMGRAYMADNRGDWNTTIAECTKALQQNPRNATAFNLRAWSKFLKNDLDSAITDTTRAIQLDLNFGYAYGTRGWARQAKGDINGARDDLKTAIALCGESSVEGIEDHGLIEFLNGNNQDAINSWQNTIQKDPTTQKTLQPWIDKAAQRAGK